MSRKARRVPYRLDSKGIRSIPAEDIIAILRGADDLIMSGGRDLLVKVLKGSREKKVLELGLDSSPVYGYYRHLRIEDIRPRVDWTILEGYLDIEYDHRLPLLVFTERGWEIERETITTELLLEFDEMVEVSTGPYDMSYLKDRDRGMIMLLLKKVRATGDPKYIPLLRAWAEIDYKKVKQRIHEVIGYLNRAAA